MTWYHAACAQGFKTKAEAEQHLPSCPAKPKEAMIENPRLTALAKLFNDEICKQEGYDPVGEEWILRDLLVPAYLLGQQSKQPFLDRQTAARVEKFDAELETARANQREADAQIAEKMFEQTGYEPIRRQTAQHIAQAIRSSR